MPSNCFFVQLSLSSEAQTEDLGARLAGLLGTGDTIALAGALGAGKTTLLRALIRKLIPGEEVASPTFTIMQTYEAPGLRLCHADLYRVKAKRELRELGFDEVLDGGALLVEWPDRMSDNLPEDRLDIILEVDDGAEDRRAKLVGRGSWAERLRSLSNSGLIS